MKKIIMAALALSAISATPAVADTVASYSVSGSVGAICSANASGSISLGNLVDSAGTLSSTGGSASDPGAYCNGAGTTIAIAHTNLSTSGGAATGFTNIVAFTPKVTAGSAPPITGDQANTIIGAFSGLTVEATSLTTGGNKPVAGGYAGSITVTLTPGV